MRGWWREMAGLVLPLACGGCGRPRTPLCEECAWQLGGRGPRRARPCPEPAGLPVVFAAAEYEDAVRALLLAHKERGVLGLAGPLGAALAGAVVAAAPEALDGAEPLLLVPVPSARRAVRARGHDAARRVAVAAAGALRRSGARASAVPVLRQCRKVADQSGLTARERVLNMTGALGVVKGAERLLEGRRAVLVDDLMTTGASLVEAARALCAATAAGPSGCVRTSAAVIAAPPLSFGVDHG
ncbi:ComF family protein [Streptomyces sp. FIT100]|uniref:ComF family protein n=1 Tax=Streptomyces sp. FIT100 TaxID=2837956 RepID=UPI0021C83E60|nr:ComF family protein [Streptomyces sp. FIT100]UUN27207.1 ComF family protein [Streptomyces sp. FIT100]